jgi:hypothetical protein
MAANNYQEYERIGREQFKKFSETNNQILNLTFSEGEYDRYDGTMLSGYSLVSIEIKKRKHSYNTMWQGQPEGFILEKTKYDGLKSVDCDEQMFITIFDDGIVIWNLTHMKPEWITRKYASNHTRQMKMNKEVTYLTLEQASHIYKL